MLHKIDIVAVVAANLGQPVGEVLTLAEQLLEAREATGHRVTSGVYDLCVGQHQVDEADMPEVVGHLVDEEGCALAMDGCVANVGLAEVAQFIWGQFCQIGGIERFVIDATATIQAVGQGKDVGQLHRSLDLRV